MESEKIEHILKKFFEAETTLQEERALQEYFNSDHVAPHLQEYTLLFTYFKDSKEAHFPKKVNDTSERKKVYSWVAIAASIAILAGIFLQKEQRGISDFGSYENPELALEKTKETLKMVSQLMNTGNEDLLYIKEFNAAKNSLLK